MNYDEAFEKVIDHEGGYVDDPSDPGGRTKYGISQRAYPDEDIVNLTLERAKELYHKDYWLRSKADKLPAEIRYAHFDMAVNAGRGAAAKNLQRAARVKVDGAIGPNTLLAASKVTISDYMFFRAVHYMRITRRNANLAKFLGGWANRIEEIWNNK